MKRKERGGRQACVSTTPNEGMRVQLISAPSSMAVMNDLGGGAVSAQAGFKHRRAIETHTNTHTDTCTDTHRHAQTHTHTHTHTPTHTHTHTHTCTHSKIQSILRHYSGMLRAVSRLLFYFFCTEPVRTRIKWSSAASCPYLFSYPPHPRDDPGYLSYPTRVPQRR